MNIAQIRKLDISNGEGTGVALFVQGCPFHCKNCFNQSTWNFDGGTPWNDQIKLVFYGVIEASKSPRISILGGEPFADQNVKTVYEILKDCKTLFPDKIIWLYTGYEFENLNDMQRKCLEYIDVLVDGPYIDELKDFSLEFRGSSNQRLIRLHEDNKDGN